MPQKMRVGFVGCGGHACGTNIPCVDRNPNFEIRAFCDLKKQQLELLEKQYRPQYVTDNFEKIFSDPQIDMVVCATKPDFRIPVMEAAVKYSKPLFVEKPLAYSKEDTYKMVKLIKESDIPFIVGFNRPYSPMMQTLKPIYKRHKSGNTLIVYRIVGEEAIWPREHREAVITKKESTVIHETTHIFDLINWLTDMVPESVYMIGGGHIDNIICIQYPDNISVAVIAGDNGSLGYPKERLEINTNCGTIISEFFTELLIAGMGDDSGTQKFEYKFKGKKYNDGFEGVREKFDKWRRNLTEAERKIGHYFGQLPEINKGHYEQHEYFRKQILSGGKIQTDVVRGAMASIMAWTTIESWQKNRPLNLDFSEVL